MMAPVQTVESVPTLIQGIFVDAPATMKGLTVNDLWKVFTSNNQDKCKGYNIIIHAEIVTQPDMKPMITQPPVSTELMDFGTPVNLTCIAEGHPPPNYQWYKDGNLIPGEIRPFIYILDPQPEHRGNYSCTANNRVGNITSKPAQITISGKW